MRQLRVAEVSLVGVAVTGTTGLRGSASQSSHVTYTGDEPITTGDAELVTGGMEQGLSAQQLTFQESKWIQIGSIAWLKRVA